MNSMEAAGDQFTVSQREQTKHLMILENSQDIKVHLYTMDMWHDARVHIMGHTHTHTQIHTYACKPSCNCFPLD